MQRTMRALLVGGLLLGFTQAAAAQSALNRPWEDRVFAGISFGVQAGSSDVNESSTFVVYDEQAALTTNSSFGASGMFDISLGARAWRNFGVALGYHSTSTSDDGEVQGSIPHPLFFDRPRTFTQTVHGMDRSEHAYHVMFGWMIPTKDNMDVFVYVGPSFFRLRQDVIAGVEIEEVGPPFTEVSVEPLIERRRKSMTGFNIGADLSYFIRTTDQYRLGVGGFFRYAGASGDIRLANTEESVGVGGAQFGFGGRVRF
jgi:hypothetical protein